MLNRVNNERGMAFILVVWVVVLLLAIGTQFAYSMRTEVNTTRNYKEDTQAYYLAKAGVNLAMAEILKKRTTIHGPRKKDSLQATLRLLSMVRKFLTMWKRKKWCAKTLRLDRAR